MLPRIISDVQSVFVPGCSIHDNGLAAVEMIHYMKHRTKGKRGSVAMKIDISKAYDRISWKYLEAVIRSEERFESLYIINCVVQVQEEALYKLGYTTLGKYKLQS